MAASDESVVVASTTDFSSDSTSDDWQDLTKSDYAKVIFSDLLCNASLGTVECKFHITDNVHEDPNDYVGLFRIGFEDLSQCLVSKMLSQTKCEDDGKLQRCVFTSNELPCLTDGFYQFLYVTRDQEICGASMPFQIKMSSLQPKESSDISSASESMDGGFLLVSNETDKKMKEEPAEQEKASVQHSTLSEQKKEEIAAWVSQNPDYYSLVEQIKEHTFTIDALQQSKDLAMREVAQLYDVLNRQNAELGQLKNMLSAYEEKTKMSQTLQNQKSYEISQIRNEIATYEKRIYKDMDLLEKKDAEIIEMRKSLAAYEEQIKSYELLQKEKEEELSRVKSEFLLQEEKLKLSLSLQDQQQIQISDLKKELEEMKEVQKAKESSQVAAKTGRHSIECLIQKAQDLACIVSDSITSIDFTDEDNLEKFYQLKIQLLIISRRMTRAMDMAHVIDQNRLHEEIQAMTERNVKGSSCPVCMPCVLENQDSVGTSAANTNTSETEKNGSASVNSSTSETEQSGSASVNTSTPETEITDVPVSSVEIVSLPSTSGKDSSNENVSTDSEQRSSFHKSFESEILELQIVELPRLDVINEDTAKTLQTNKPLHAKDISVINRLTEKIIKRGFNLYDAIETIDDSSSDSGSDVSEISEHSSSMKKDMFCVFRVMDALSSYLCNQTSLDHLVVVEKEEDKNLRHRNKWDVLLQKCALHYQIELLLEHIEKQKEGIKKVSEKICDLLTKYMMLKDQATESKTACEQLQSVILKKDLRITDLKEELEFKDSLFVRLHSQKEELESRKELLERTVEDYRARLVEASNLYKKQYTEIEKLSKKEQKYKALKEKLRSSKRESSVVSSQSSGTLSSFEVVKENSVQNISDSDTGEHMFEKALEISNEKNQDSKPSVVDHFPVQSFVDVSIDKAGLCEEAPCGAPSEAHLAKDEEIQAQNNSSIKSISSTIPESHFTSPVSTLNDALPSTSELKTEESIIQATMSAETAECQSNQTTPLFSDFESYEHFQEVIKESFVNIKSPTASGNFPECSISCYVCKEILLLCPETAIDLINHLEREHSMKMCPVCGQLFEDAIPPKYFHIHVEQHFETQ